LRNRSRNIALTCSVLGGTLRTGTAPSANSLGTHNLVTLFVTCAIGCPVSGCSLRDSSCHRSRSVGVRIGAFAVCGRKCPFDVLVVALGPSPNSALQSRHSVSSTHFRAIDFRRWRIPRRMAVGPEKLDARCARLGYSNKLTTTLSRSRSFFTFGRRADSHKPPIPPGALWRARKTSLTLSAHG